MPAAGVVLTATVVLIVLVLVFYLVSTILALRKITTGLNETIAVLQERQRRFPNDQPAAVAKEMALAQQALGGGKKAGKKDNRGRGHGGEGND